MGVWTLLRLTLHDSTDRQTDKRTDGWTDATKRIISPASRSIKIKFHQINLPFVKPMLCLWSTYLKKKSFHTLDFLIISQANCQVSNFAFHGQLKKYAEISVLTKYPSYNETIEFCQVCPVLYPNLCEPVVS